MPSKNKLQFTYDMDKRLQKGALLMLALFFTTFAALAQVSIKGKVTEANKNGLPGVTVKLGTNGAVTNEDGVFTFESVEAGKHLLTISSVGYETQKQVVVVKKRPVENLNFVLAASTTDLANVTVYGGSLTRSGKAIEDIPGSTHYLSPEELAVFNYTDVNNVLAFIPGVNMVQEDGWGLRPNIGIRGTGSERSSKITLMEDGILVAPAPYTAPAAYYFPSAGRMQAFEVLKGASQIKYGPNTTGGAFNMVSTPIPTQFSGMLNANVGSYGMKNVHAHAGTSTEHFGLLVETFQQSADGFKNLPNGDPTGFNKSDYMVKGRINTGKEAKIYQALSFKIGYNEEVSNETYLGLTDADFEADPFQRYAASAKDKMETSQQLYSLEHVIEPTDFLSVTTTLYRTEFARNWYKLNKVNGNGISGIMGNPADFQQEYLWLTGQQDSPDDIFEVKANNRTYYAQGIQSRLNAYFETGNIKHAPEIGIRYHEDGLDRFQWVDDYKMTGGELMMTTKGQPGTDSNRLEDAYAFSGYFQYGLTLGNLSLIPGIRYENIYQTKNDYGKNDVERSGADLKKSSNAVAVLLPGIGAEYKISGLLSTFAGVHKGFSPPGSKEDTNPEESVNYELGIRANSSAWNLSVVYFYNDYQNLLGADLSGNGGTGSGELFNGGQVHSQGLELEAVGNLLHQVSTHFKLPVFFTYSYTSARFQNDFESDFEPWGTVTAGDYLPYVAPHQLALSLGLEHRKFSINMATKYQSAMRTIAGQGDLEPTQSTDEIMTMDLSAHYFWGNNVEFYANWNNITNATYVVSRRPAGVRPNMPSVVMAGVKLTF
ncbi:TonB-dependent receptor [Persicobacter diffluens]|uniref:TonB-dependent receptor n=2 Tax=Persicobacter diffluens TaxID=981 RepID=A0AAN4W0F6_9BACT|nr:TonB-dependent receptor [Persicobacter diffluens]